MDATLSGLAGGFIFPPTLSLDAYQDGVAEQSEGFVLLLEIEESELDPRDVGNVSLSRSVYLVRINQSGIYNNHYAQLWLLSVKGIMCHDIRTVFSELVSHVT